MRENDIFFEFDQNEEGLIRVEASKLRLDDEFLASYEPESEVAQELKALIVGAIEQGVQDFYKPAYVPTIAKKAGPEKKWYQKLWMLLTGQQEEPSYEVHFLPGKAPAVGRTLGWWLDHAGDYRIGTRWEYGAFLGWLIKSMMERGYSVELAWDTMCRVSYRLGAVLESSNRSRNFMGFYDLINCYKYVAVERVAPGEEASVEYWIVGSALCCEPVAVVHGEGITVKNDIGQYDYTVPFFIKECPN